MVKVFDYIKRSDELMRAGVPLEEAVAIMNKEESEADVFVLNDGLWTSDLAAMRKEAILKVNRELKKQKNKPKNR